MKEILAAVLLAGAFGAVLTLVLRKKIGTGMAALMLGFGLLAGGLVLNYETLGSLIGTKGYAVSQEQFNSMRDASLEQVRAEVEKQVEALKVLSASLSEKMEGQVRQAEGSSLAIKKIEIDLAARQQTAKEIADKIDQLRDRVGAIHRADCDLALMITRLAWLQLEGRTERDSGRAEEIARQVSDQLDAIVNLALPDPAARAHFISEVTGSVAGQE